MAFAEYEQEARSSPQLGFHAGGLVDADTAGSVGRYEQEAAGHHQVFVEIDRVGCISDWQMDGEGGHQAPNGERESDPPRLITNQDQYFRQLARR